MTIYGGEQTTWGTRNGGFLVLCCKCGWHSKVEIYADHVVVFKCHRCGNEHTEE